MMDKIIQVTNLEKKYKKKNVLKKISFAVKSGELFSILGPNGAGKSTTISILCGFVHPTSGQVELDDKTWNDAGETLKKEIGIVFQSSVLDKVLSGKENLEIRACFYEKNKEQAKKRAKQCAQSVDALAFWEQPYGTLSGGQQRRIDIARALLGNPKILFLDEPTTGLDVISRYRMWEMIQILQKERQLTVILTTHYMEEATSSDRILLLNEGGILAIDTPNALKEQYDVQTIENVFIKATIGDELK